MCLHLSKHCKRSGWGSRVFYLRGVRELHTFICGCQNTEKIRRNSHKHPIFPSLHLHSVIYTRGLRRWHQVQWDFSSPTVESIPQVSSNQEIPLVVRMRKFLLT